MRKLKSKRKFLKQRYYEAGPKASKMLAWRIRKQQAENSIHKMRDPITNKVTTKLEEIQNAFEKYYRLLCTQPAKSDRLTIQTFLSSLDLPSIGKNQYDKLICEIITEEIDNGILIPRANKSPDCDGFPPECLSV